MLLNNTPGMLRSKCVKNFFRFISNVIVESFQYKNVIIIKIRNLMKAGIKEYIVVFQIEINAEK